MAVAAFTRCFISKKLEGSSNMYLKEKVINLKSGLIFFLQKNFSHVTLFQTSLSTGKALQLSA
jgi:hypothetical protein